ncbi:MAG: hypothetical protein ACLFUU_05950 [Desulfobacteraceae bacterium]
MRCPACNNEKGNREVNPGSLVFRCGKCEAIFSKYLYLGESYEYVRPYFAQDEVPFEQLRYYDFTCIGSEGVVRRHGWYDPQTRLIHQVG